MSAVGLGSTSPATTTMAFDDADEAVRGVGAARACAADVPMLVRCRDDSRLETLYDAGATEVLIEDLEGSLMPGAQLLLVLEGLEPRCETI